MIKYYEVDFSAIPGAVYVPDYVISDEESTLLEAVYTDDVDNGWVTVPGSDRRVRQFGWRYPYRGIKKITPDMYIGSLPPWTDQLIKRFRSDRLVAEQPDQLIVNEYTQSQGIAGHIDCPTCFTDFVVTLSIGRGREMIFRHKEKKWKSHKYLEPRSLFVLKGPARSEYPRTLLVFEGPARSDYAHHIPPVKQLPLFRDVSHAEVNCLPRDDARTKIAAAETYK